MQLLTNISTLYTCKDEGGQGDLHPVENAAVAWQDGVIKWVGPESGIPGEFAGTEVFNAGGRMVVPGLVDCHVHLASNAGAAHTVDFRYLSRARAIPQPNLASQTQCFGTQAMHWQVEQPRGVPCHPDTYQDASARTVDMRTPSWRRGHHHPNRVLVYAAPRTGFFAEGQLRAGWDRLQSWLASFDASAVPFSPIGTGTCRWTESPR
jgi:hypothetical protein